MTSFSHVNDPASPQSRLEVQAGHPGSTERRVVALIGPGPLPAIMINALVDEFGPLVILKESKEPMKQFLNRRRKLLGIWQMLGQTAFGFYSRFAGRFSEKRKQEIIEEHGLDTGLPQACTVIPVGSANSAFSQEALQVLRPDVVFVVGTRMLKKSTLETTPATFLNYHAGINPKYRGMNGGYWSLVNNDPENHGATMHIVDAGVDTGDVLYQVRVTPERNDTIHTYPLLLAAHARMIAVQSVKDALSGKLSPKRVVMSSRQWFHPTLHGYFWTGLTRGIW